MLTTTSPSRLIRANFWRACAACCGVSGPHPLPRRPPKRPKSIPVGRYTLNLRSRLLTDADAIELPITTMEFDLLSALAGHPNQILSREQLQALAHDRRWDPLDRSIDVRITRLRRKIEADPLHPRIIRTIRGKGYMFVPDNSA